MKHFREPAVTGFLAVGLLALFAGSLKADQLAYLLGGGGGPTQAFGTVDLNTGAYTSLGSIPSGVTGLGVAGGTLYTDANGTDTLESINTSNGALTAIGNSGVAMSNFGSTTTGLYFIDGFTQDLYSINPLTAAPTLIGSTGLPLGVAGTALSSNSGTLYLAWQGSLYTVNTTTGAATLAGSNAQGYALYALLFEGGTLNGGVDSGGEVDGVFCQGCIVTVDPGAGAVTQGTTNTEQSFAGLAPDPLTTATAGTPEPATWSQFAIALVALLFGRRRLAGTLSRPISNPKATALPASASGGTLTFSCSKPATEPDDPPTHLGLHQCVIGSEFSNDGCTSTHKLGGRPPTRGNKKYSCGRKLKSMLEGDKR